MPHLKATHSALNTGSMQRVLHDARGNVLPIMAAGLIPLAALIGGGIDTSRGYMVKSKLQQACDAAALAGRKALSDSNPSSDAETIAGNFFRANFPADYMGTSNSKITRLAGSQNGSGNSEYTAQATVTLPTVVMHVFGKDSFKLSITCGAIYEVSNSDVTMVLDVTGSMENDVNGNSTSNTSKKRITALKNAMKNFFDTVDDAAQNSNARIRYAFVPYVETVNVGRLLDPSWIADTHTYQSALKETVTTTTPGEVVEHFRSNNKTYTRNCSAYYGYWHNSYIYGRYDSSTGYCIWDDYHEGTQETTTTYKYSQREIDTSVYKTFAGVRNPTNLDTSMHYWNGCIEERETSPGATWSYNATSKRIQSNTGDTPWDLDIDSLPGGSDASKWKPHWPEISYLRNYNETESTSGERVSSNCPNAAQKLTEMTESAYDAYVDGLTTGGGTYHDVGLLWGARLSSPDGIFQSNVREAAPNNGYVSRHMIFMTDGLLTNYEWLYTMYGIERHDRRITNQAPTRNYDNALVAAQEARSQSRFLAICDAVKAKGIRLWVVSFGTTLTNELKTCASADSAFVSTNADELNQNFADIAQTVASLRLAR